ncbi:MAG: NYN domain-containing protein [Patescibacteria group bacterium]
MDRALIIIDGSNFYHRLKEAELHSLLSFGYNAFATFLTRGHLLVSARYYIGAIREEQGNEKSRKLMSNQRKLSGFLKKSGFEVCFGDLLKNDGVYHEKGVDVRMAVDLLVGAYENLYDIAIIVSSDTDLIPAIMKVRSMGKKVEYVGFSHKPSHALITHSDIRRLLSKEDLEQFILEKEGII